MTAAVGEDVMVKAEADGLREDVRIATWNMFVERSMQKSSEYDEGLQNMLGNLEFILAKMASVIEACCVEAAIEGNDAGGKTLDIGPALAAVMNIAPGKFSLKSPEAIPRSFREMLEKSKSKEEDEVNELAPNNSEAAVPLNVKLELMEDEPADEDSLGDSAEYEDEDDEDGSGKTTKSRRVSERRNLHPNYECKECSRTFTYLVHFQKHSLKCGGAQSNPLLWKKENNRFFCAHPACAALDKSWTTSTGVWQHYGKEHPFSTGLIFPCEYCEKAFPNKTFWSDHMNRFHVKRFMCETCGKKFPTHGALKYHYRTHNLDKPYACDSCDHRAKTKGAMDRHRLLIHLRNQKKDHCCDICGKRFIGPSPLRDHIRTHSTEKAFCCNMCGKALKSRQSLQRHLITHGIMHTCKICSKNFTAETSLAVHLRDKHGVLHVADLNVVNKVEEEADPQAAQTSQLTLMPPPPAQIPQLEQAEVHRGGSIRTIVENSNTVLEI